MSKRGSECFGEPLNRLGLEGQAQNDEFKDANERITLESEPCKAAQNVWISTRIFRAAGVLSFVLLFLSPESSPWDLPNASKHWNNFLRHSVLDNWEVSRIASFISGQPMSVGLGAANGENITGGGDGAHVIITGNAVLPKSKRTFNHYFNPNAFALRLWAKLETHEMAPDSTVLGLITGT